MGNCQCTETGRKRMRLSLESETFSEPSADFSQSSLEPKVLTDFLITKLRPEYKKRSVAFVPPITPKLVDSLKRGQRVSIGVIVKDTKKLRMRLLSSNKLESRVVFSETSTTIRQILEQLGIKSNAEVVYENVCLPKELELFKLPKSVLTLTVLTRGRSDWQSYQVCQDLVVWRLTTPGLNFEGECLNQHCCAYSQIVFMSKGLGSFILQAETMKSNPCPVCNRATQLRSLGVSFCTYRLQSASMPDCPFGKVETEYLPLYKFEDLGLTEVIVETQLV